MPKKEFYNVREMCVDGQVIPERSLVISVTPGKGFDTQRALAAIASGQVVEKSALPPEEAKPEEGSAQ